MAAPKGNRFWEIRKTHGRDPIFKDADQMMEDCCSYFEWVEENPLQEARAVSFQGVTEIEYIPKMRAMTIGGLCVYLGIGMSTWDDYRKKDGFSGVVGDIEEIIRDQKFTGAAADMLNANIIARDLGLRDKKDIDHSSTDGSMSTTASKEVLSALKRKHDAK